MNYDVVIPGACVESVKALKDSERGRLWLAVIVYQSECRELSLAGGERYLWPEFKAAINKQRQEEAALRLKRAEAGKASAKAKNTCQQVLTSVGVPPSSPLESPINPPVSPKKEKPPKGGKKKERFLPPTIDEVRAYCLERKNNVDPVAFVDYYETNGWTRGKNRIPIADWKACVRTWEHNGYGSTSLAPEPEKPKQRRFVGTEINEYGEEVNVYEYV